VLVAAGAEPLCGGDCWLLGGDEGGVFCDEVSGEPEVCAISEPPRKKSRRNDRTTPNLTDVDAQVASEINAINGPRLA
jgi:hypothetical protein